MKLYPKYKDSGVEWIGKVPEGWEKSKIKFCTEFINGYAFKSDDYVTTEGIPLIRIGDIKPEIDFNEAQKVPEEYAAIFKTFAVKKNDILVALTGATIGKSSVYKSTRPALLNQRVAILRPKGETHNNFLKFFIDSDIFKKLIEYECVGGAQENIGKKEIGSCVLYLPKLLDQVQTSLFLDRKTAQIDNLISKKQKLIELLKEERAAIINQAVTKGLNPDAPMKDSGIEWLGEVSYNWEKTKIKFSTKFINGYAFKPDDYVNSKGIPIIRIGDIKPEIDFNKAQKVPEEYAETFKAFTVKKNDILVALTGATIGKSTIYKSVEPALLNQRVGILRPKDKIHLNFLKYFIGSNIFKQLIDYECIGGAQENIGKEEIGSCVLYLPKLQDQIQTSLFLDRKTTKTDQTTSKIEKQIDLLKELRTALISEAVTGKIDVRDEESNE